MRAPALGRRAEHRLEGIAGAGLFNAGQDCTAACRIYAGAKIHDKLVADLKAKGVQIDTPDKASFQKATAGVVSKWEASPIGPFVKQVVAAARAQ